MALQTRRQVVMAESRSVTDRFLQYCQWTSLHGFCFFLYQDGNSFIRRIFWSVIIFLSVVGALFVVGINIKDFAGSTVSYDLETPTNPLTDVYFPSMVICNMNQMRSSFIWALLEDPLLQNRTFLEIHQLLEKVFIKGQDSELSDTDSAIIDLVLQTRVYEDLFEEILVVGSGQTVNTTKSNIPIFHHHRMLYTNVTDENREEMKRVFFHNLATQFRYGDMMPKLNFVGHGAIVDVSFSSDVSDTCMWITPLVLEPKSLDFREVLPFARNGIQNGMKLLLDAEVYDYASPIDSKAGFIFTVLHHLDIAILKQTGSIAMPGQAVQVAITPTLTSSKGSIRHRFDPVARQCYFEDEIDFAYLPEFGFRYEMSNCLFEAAIQKVARDCQCISSFVLAYIEEGQTLPVCEGPGKLCMSKIMEDIGTERNIYENGNARECLAACYDQSHQFLVTSSAYPSKQSFHLGNDFCLILTKLRTSCSNEKRTTLSFEYPILCPALDETNPLSCDQIRGLDNSSGSIENRTLLTSLRKDIAKYASENLVALDIYIRDPYVRLYMRREKITIISFIGNIGGLLGLFLGFSFISVVEVFYIFCCGNKSNSQRKSSWTGQNQKDSWKRGRGLNRPFRNQVASPPEPFRVKY